MNTRRMGLLATLLAALILPGCLEQEITTTVNADGSCDRVVVIQKEGEEFPKGPFPLRMDSSWEMSRTKAGDKGNAYRWTFKKHFASFEDLAREYAGAPAPGKIGVTIQLEKHFRWFYSYFTYRETYSRHTNLTLVSPSAVMTEDEILRYTYGDTSKALKDKHEEWAARNGYEILYRAMVRGAGRLHNGALAAHLAAHKEEFFQIAILPATVGGDFGAVLAAQPGFKGSKNDLMDSGELTTAGADEAMKLAARVFGSDSLRYLRDDFLAGWREVEGLLAGGSEGVTFTNVIVMPGVILETGAPEVKGSSAAWKFVTDNLSLHDYTMQVESRVVNLWAMILTGVLVLGLLVLLVAAPMLARRRGPRVPAPTA